MESTADLTTGYVSLIYREALNGRGGWVLTYPENHPGASALSQPGDGIVVLDPETDEQLFSGPIGVGNDGARLRYSYEAAGRQRAQATIAATGPDDTATLWHRLALPPEHSDRFEATGPVGSAVAALIAANMGPDAGPGRAFPGWTITDTGLGPQASISARYTFVGDVAAAAIGTSDYRMETRWSEGSLEFSVQPLDHLDLPVSIEAGTASAIDADVVPATASAVYYLGQGDGADRASAVFDASGGDPWRRVEALSQQAGADGATLTDLAQAAVLTGGRSLAVTFELSRFRSIPRVGQSVDVRLGEETLRLAVADSTTTITAERQDTVVTLGRKSTAGVNGLVDTPLVTVEPA